MGLAGLKQLIYKGGNSSYELPNRDKMAEREIMSAHLNAHSNLINQVFRYYSTDLFKDAIPKGSYVLDCGAGDGAVAPPLAGEHGCKVMCLDMEQSRLDNIMKVREDRDIDVKQGDVNQIPFDDNTFDAVYSRMVLPMQKDWRVTVREKLRVCKPGGIVTFHHNSQKNLDFSLATAKTGEARDYVARGLTRKGRCTTEDLEQLCRKSGAALLKVTPLSFFITSSLIYRTGMPEDEVIKYEADLNRHMKNEAVYEFVDWFERSVVSRLPQEISGMMVAVLKKND